MSQPEFHPLDNYQEYPLEGMRQRAGTFLAEMQRRRSVRDYSPRAVPRDLLEACLSAATTAPSGANLQPWHFVLVSDPEVKRQIRTAAEAEEHEFYTRRATAEWLAALAPLGTDEHKPYLEIAPYLIAIFVKTYTLLPDGRRMKHYYAHESVGIATGILITALHLAGLVTLTHTPSPMGFLNKILDRPVNEKPYLLLVTGYPAENAQVPAISKKPLEEVVSFR